MSILESLGKLVQESGFAMMLTGDGWKNLVMIIIACVLLYLGIKKQYEPLLMTVIVIVGKIFTAKKAAPAEEKAAPAAAAPAAPKKLAPGSAGEVKIYDTDPRDAAMIMAIVADKLQKPLNELRFVSIKEVK